ncbi:hypothetical protein CC78DRAFT_622030 [Lojkania enalia]|uniref:Uncharacterized protein n=1 Tax=Lojkania enalia TaxID=147567 RepID=A0A9P4MXF0_9PLEO|nr:hypothetical protein CC78DRAFT_622030 [Didymosphaeria enalia]
MTHKIQWINNVKKGPLHLYRGSGSDSGANSHASRESHNTIAIAGGSEPSRRIAHSCAPAVTQDSYIRSDGAGIFEPELGSTEPLTSQTESVDFLAAQWSDHIFQHIYEPVFGLALGRNGCPLVNDPSSVVCLPITKPFRKLDTYIDEDLDSQSASSAYGAAERKQPRNTQIDHSLRCAIQAFTARWLPLVSLKCHLTTSQVEEIVRHSWREARKEMLKVINRTSYRSVLTLYLFTQSPTPVGIAEDEELDGISGPVCLQTAFLQGQMLRGRRGYCQFDASEVATWTGALACSITCANLASTYLDFESKAYWATVAWDTSSSLTINFRTCLTSGLKGTFNTT